MTVCEPRDRAFGIVWGFVLATGLIALVTAQTATAFSMGLMPAMQFAGAIALGPFAEYLHHGRIGPDIPFAAFALVLISAHFIHPSKWTFFLTCIGIVIWVGSGAVIVSMLA